jgi:hypothetical protein
MLYSKIIGEALIRSCSSGYFSDNSVRKLPADLDLAVSMLIHDLFGAEILKTHSGRGWHFYNRIEGVRVDFTNTLSPENNLRSGFEDIQTTPEETSAYIDSSDYNSFLTSFIRAYEETLGLGNQATGAA